MRKIVRKDTLGSNNGSRPYLNDEMELLLCCARARINNERSERIKTILDRELDWNRLISTANYHGLTPLLYNNLKKIAPDAVPAETLDKLRKIYLFNTQHNIVLTREMLHILEKFETNEIPAIPFKGPALAHQLFGDITLRVFEDLDIIIPKQQVLKAKKILLAEGYLPEVLLNSSQESFFLKSECEYNFIKELDRLRIEVHWKLAESCCSIPFDEDGLWSRTKMEIFEGRKILTLSLEDLLIALCINGARHCWQGNQLKLICDISELIDPSSSLDLNSAFSSAKELHIERIFLLGLMLARVLLGAEVPENILLKAENDHAIRKLYSVLWHGDRLEIENSSRLRDETYFWLNARERFVDKVCCISRQALEPNTMDWMLISLPVQLYPLYYLIHPARLIFSYGIK